LLIAAAERVRGALIFSASRRAYGGDVVASHAPRAALFQFTPRCREDAMPLTMIA